MPCVSDRALQRSASQVMSAIYEQEFLPCSFGGRPGLGAHNALATLNEVISGSKVGWVLEADVKNFFGSLDHKWMMRFVEHRIGGPRLISLVRRWLKAGVLEDGVVHPSNEGTPQGGSISVLLSNVYLHNVLDLWFERVVKPRLRGEAYLVRYIDDSDLRDLMRRCRHLPLEEQVININRVLRGHFAYYGIAGNFRALQRVHRIAERYWRKMLSSRSRKGQITWDVFHRIVERYPLQRPKLYLNYRQMQAIAVL